jgi:hypothetical protein
MSTDNPDPLEDLLFNHMSCASHEAMQLRHTTLARTIPPLRRRRFIRRFVLGTGLMSFYFAGLVSAGIWPRDPAVVAVSKGRPEGKELAQLNDTADRMPISMIQQPSLAVALSEKFKKSDFDTLRYAGDDAWQGQHDLEAAIRFYAEALKLAKPNELMISVADDNWLLIALKESHIKENSHARQNNNL